MARLLLLALGLLLGLSPAERLESARRLAGTDREAARALVLELAGGGEDDVTRWDARLWMASDALRADDGEAALRWTAPLWERVLADDLPPPLERRTDSPGGHRRLETRTADLHSRALASLGRTDEARTVDRTLQARDRKRTGSPERVEQPGAPSTELDRAAQAAQARTRRALGGVSWCVLALFLLGAAPAARRGLTGGGRPWGAGVVAAFALLGCGLAEAWADGAGAAAAWMVAGFVVVHLVSAYAGRGTERRALVGGAAALATVAVGFLALDHADTLGWVGL